MMGSHEVMKVYKGWYHMMGSHLFDYGFHFLGLRGVKVPWAVEEKGPGDPLGDIAPAYLRTVRTQEPPAQCRPL